MFCTHCGAEIKPGAKFCTSCGTKVPAEFSELTNPAAESVAAVSAVSSEAAAAAPEAVQAATEAAAENTESVVASAEETVKDAAEAVKTAEVSAAAAAPETVTAAAATAEAEAAETAAKAEEIILEKVEAPAPEVAREIPPTPAAPAQPEPTPVTPVAPAQPEPTPATPVAPAPTPAAPVKKASEPPYAGMSAAKKFRIVFGVMSILTYLYSIIQVLNPFIQRILMTQDFRWAEFGSAVITTAVANAFVLLVPGIVSMILAKPTRVKSAILAGILFMTAIGWIIAVLASANLRLISGTIQIRQTIGTVFSSSAFYGLWFAAFIALLTIFQPAAFVKEPGKISARPWKIISGIFHIIGGVFMVLGAILIVVIAALESSSVSQGFAMASLVTAILGVGLYMLLTGLYSTSSTRSNAIVITYFHLITIVKMIAFAATIINTVGWISGEVTQVATSIIAIVMIVLAFWYFVGFVISFITMFFRKQHS